MSTSVPPKKPVDSEWRRAMHEAAPLLSLGMQMALTMALLVGGGFWLDRWLGTSPLLTIGGAVLGVVSLFVYLFRLVGTLDKKGKKRGSGEPPAG